MKTNTILLTSMMMFFVSLIHAQETTEKTFLNFTGSFNDIGDISGGNSSMHATTGDNLKLDLNFGRFINDKFAIGVGFEYSFLNRQSYSNINIPNDFYLNENFNTKSNVYAPYAFVKYRKPITSRLNFDLNLKAQYGFIKANNNYNLHKLYYTDSDVYEITEIPENISIYGNTEGSGQFLDISLQPELNYFITKKFGVLLKLGGVNYTNVEFNNGTWNVDFKPTNWQYGITFRF